MDTPDEGAAATDLGLQVPAEDTLVPGGVLTRRVQGPAFEVHLDVYSGPFELLLGLIAKHRLDVTEIALAQITDEFMAHIRGAQARDGAWDVSGASEFVLVAATLLDLKAARLLPHGEGDDEEDLALIEARDLLFARLLQYRAYKEVAATFGRLMATQGRARAREVSLEPQFLKLLPELVMTISPDQLAIIAAAALTPKPAPTVGLAHLHAPAVSVRDQAELLVDRLRREGQASFRALVRDADSTLIIVARFLALLELFRDGAVAFEQAEALTELGVRWIGPTEGAIKVDDEFDRDDPTATAGDPAYSPQPGARDDHPPAG